MKPNAWALYQDVSYPENSPAKYGPVIAVRFHDAELRASGGVIERSNGIPDLNWIKANRRLLQERVVNETLAILRYYRLDGM
jgi:hypothetical protein